MRFLYRQKKSTITCLFIIGLLFSCSQQSQYTYQIPTRTDDGWETGSLSDADVDRARINDLIQDIRSEQYKNIHSVLLVRNGKLILEEYFNGCARDTIHELHSVSKTITSALVGISIDKNLIPDVDAQVYEFFPEYKGTRWIEQKYNITLEHVLIMAAGIDWDERTRPLGDSRNDIYALIHHSDNWIKYVLNKDLIEPPGRRWNYSGGLNILLGGIIKNASGLYADKFAEEYLFGPLGIEDYFWHRHPDGTINTQGGLSLRSRDMAKIGYLFLKGGSWHGKQIVSKEWVVKSTKEHINTGSHGYGYQWYTGKAIVWDTEIEAFWAWGRGGQFIFVFPTLELVAVFTSNPYDNQPGLYQPFSMLTQYIIPAMLPPAPPRKSIKLKPRVVERYLGKYKAKQGNDIITIFSEGDKLYVQAPDEDIDEIFAKSEDQFFGTSKVIGDFQAKVIKDQKGEIKHLTVHFARHFGSYTVEFEKIK